MSTVFYHVPAAFRPLPARPVHVDHALAGAPAHVAVPVPIDDVEDRAVPAEIPMARLARLGAHDAATTRGFIQRMADALLSRAHLSEDLMHHIAGLSDPVLRNLRITLAYHDLTVGMSDVIGLPNIAWVAFAAWASKSAGRFIRREPIPQVMREYASSVPVLGDALLDMSAHIAHGNWLVFAELGPLFARAIALFGRDSRYRPETLEALLAELRPGETARSGEGGQDLLAEAFSAYYRARFESHPKRKAELVLMANIMVGLHEQIRLDPTIDGAFFTPVTRLSRRIVDRLTGDRLTGDRLTGSLPAPLSRHLGRMAAAAAGGMRAPMLAVWRRMITELMITLTLPTGALRVGRDVPGFADGRYFPDELVTTEHPRLRALIARYDQNPASPAGSSSERWDDLANRMNFIIDLFRMYQQNALLFAPPFSRSQRRLIYRDIIPGGEL